MEPRRDFTTKGPAVPAPTATVNVTDRDEIDVWVVGEGAPVVLIHGALVWSLLKPLAEELAERGHRAIWYHRRGYRGKPTEPPVGIPDQARDVVAILDALEIRRAHVVGHSAGATYALALATLAQDRLLSAVLLDSVLVHQAPSRDLFLEAMKPSIGRARTGDFEGAAAQLFEALGATEELLEQAVPGSWSAMAKDARTWFQVDAPAGMEWIPEPADVGAIEVPLAFMQVTDLPPFHETGELLRAWQPNLTMLEIATDHHFFPVTATEETAQVIDDWIRSQSREE